MVEKPVQRISGGGRNSITAGPLLVQDYLLLALRTWPIRTEYWRLDTSLSSAVEWQWTINGAQ
jgi:hypothetical protein